MLTIHKTNDQFFELIPETGLYKGSSILFTTSICDGPICPCKNIALSFFEQNTLTQPELNSIAHVSVDIATKKISNDRPSNELGKSFAESFSESDWSLLSNLFYSIKLNITENKKIPVKDLNFPVNEIEQEGLHLAYLEVLPYGEQFSLEVNEIKYIAVDSYCVRKDCKCTECGITFVPENQKSYGRDYSFILIDYRSGSLIRKKENPNVTISVMKLFEQLKMKYPDLLSKLAKRKEKLTSLYVEYRAFKFQNAEKSQTPKIGRNDPCFCGSGKKFKKCCISKSNSTVQNKTWIDQKGFHFVQPGTQPTKAELENLTLGYQQNIKKSPLWKEMVKAFGNEKANDFLSECKVTTK